MSAKQKIVHGHGLSNPNLGIFVCSFDVCRASKPDPSINYGWSEEQNFWSKSQSPLLNTWAQWCSHSLSSALMIHAQEVESLIPCWTWKTSYVPKCRKGCFLRFCKAWTKGKFSKMPDFIRNFLKVVIKLLHSLKFLLNWMIHYEKKIYKYKVTSKILKTKLQKRQNHEINYFQDLYGNSGYNNWLTKKIQYFYKKDEYLMRRQN